MHSYCSISSPPDRPDSRRRTHHTLPKNKEMLYGRCTVCNVDRPHCLIVSGMHTAQLSLLLLFISPFWAWCLSTQFLPFFFGIPSILYGRPVAAVTVPWLFIGCFSFLPFLGRVPRPATAPPTSSSSPAGERRGTVALYDWTRK